MFSKAAWKRPVTCLLRQARKRHMSSARFPSSQAPVIVAACRTPIGSWNGSLATQSATQLGAVAIKNVMQRAGLEGKEVDEVFMGNVVSAGVGQAPATQAAIHGGLPMSVPATTINKVCASGMKAIMFAASSIVSKQNSVVVAGGMESMSNIPYYVPKARFGYGYGHGELIDGVLKDGLWDAFDNHHMGMCAERCSSDYSINREAQDAYAISSYRRAIQATQSGLFQNEIVPVEVTTKKGVTIVREDEEYKKANFEKIPTLRPAFKKDGTVTAANSSALNDGAAAVVVVSAEYAASRGLKPLARILGFADAQKPPIEFTTAPALAIPKAIANAGLTPQQIDYYEINEAFAVVALANNKLLNLDPERVNVNGGAVALGHPIGVSGARIVVTLLNVLKQRKGRIGTAAICNGGGGASAIVIESLQ